MLEEGAQGEQTSLSHQQLKDIIQQEGINNPVLAVRIVGGRVELHLLGGMVHKVDRQPTTGTTPTTVLQHTPITSSQFLDNLTVPQLKQLAALLNLNITARMRKGQLVELMSPYSIAELKEVANKLQIV